MEKDGHMTGQIPKQQNDGFVQSLVSDKDIWDGLISSSLTEKKHLGAIPFSVL